MAQKFNCDLCYKDIPIPENIQKIEIGGTKIADACLNCAQQLTNGIKETIALAAKKMAEAQIAVAPPPPQPEAPAPTSNKTESTVPPIQPKPRDGPAPQK